MVELATNIDHLIDRYYREYTTYIDKTRVCPSLLDSFKAVQRRVLYAAYKVANKKMTKSATIVGETMGKYHPHGDKSIYNTLVSLVRHGLLKGRGNFGLVGLTELEPAAMRYTEAGLYNTVLFKYIDYVPYIENDLGNKEPLYIPFPIPLMIVALTDQASMLSGIGIGYKVLWPLISLSSAYRLLKAFIGLNDFPRKIQIVSRGCILTVPTRDVLNKTSFELTFTPQVDENGYITAIPQGIKASKFDQDKLKDYSSDSIYIRYDGELPSITYKYSLYVATLVGKRNSTIYELFKTTLSAFKTAFEKWKKSRVEEINKRINLWRYVEKNRSKILKAISSGKLDDIPDFLHSITISQLTKSKNQLDKHHAELKDVKQFKFEKAAIEVVEELAKTSDCNLIRNML